MNKILIGAIAGIVLVVCGWYFFGQDRSAAGSDAYAWIITPLEHDADAFGTPRTAVALQTSGGTYEIGEFTGACSEIEGSGWQLLEDEVTGVICWWAGGGSEIGVFDEGGSHVVKVGVLDEGSAEVPGFRGDFTTVQTL